MGEVVREIMIDASPETIWPFLTEPEKHRLWEGTLVDIDPRPGGTYRVLVAGQFQSVGEYVEVVPLEKIAFTFGWEDEGNPVRPGMSLVEITLHPEGNKTRVRLVHSRLPDDSVEAHGHGWAHSLERLAARAVGGDPGPDLAPGGAA